MKTSPASETPLQIVLNRLEYDFKAANPKSLAQHQVAAESLAGGHTRQTLMYSPYPLSIAHSTGARVTDIDGHEYLDFLGDYTAGLYGHSNEVIADAALKAMSQGISVGGVTLIEAEFADLICSRIPSIEQMRFCNSGTEACLFAVTIARAITQRSSVIVFRGAYHGGFMVFGESDDSLLNIPGDFIKCPFNDIRATCEAIRNAAPTLAAVIVEPVMGSGGAIPATREFLQMLRKETESADSILIFDEVMTSRLAPGGAQSIYDIKPDLTTLGKFWGGGFNFGAFGGSRHLMRHLDSSDGGTLKQAGTFNNNIVTMAAGLAGARDVYTPTACIELNRRGDELRLRMNTLSKKSGVNVQVTGLGAVMNIHFHCRTISSHADIEDADSSARRLFHMAMLERGMYVARRGLISLSLEHTNSDIESLLDAVRDFYSEYQHFLNC
ncbi:MAG TPA: aminotransferase class III-fold pyridoxal phosphate-dependent enzyme [Woeseiaceae bacterium]|nr:aminotransferase class III-fold pyridoxal phosphate-dependent enzyme [Woeseiaceae bacterium]